MRRRVLFTSSSPPGADDGAGRRAGRARRHQAAAHQERAQRPVASLGRGHRQDRGRHGRPHGKYKSFSFDAAVVHLASPINGIRPMMLVTPGVDALERPGTLATVTGWGNTIQQPAGPGGGGVNYPTACGRRCAGGCR